MLKLQHEPQLDHRVVASPPRAATSRHLAAWRQASRLKHSASGQRSAAALCGDTCEVMLCSSMGGRLVRVGRYQSDREAVGYIVAMPDEDAA